MHLAVDDAGTGQTVRRDTVFPVEDSDVLVRLITLAIAELVLTERAAPPPDRATVARAPLNPPAVRANASSDAATAVPAAHHVHLLAFGQVLGPFSGVGTAWGGGLRLGWTFRTGALNVAPVIEGDLSAAKASADRSLGSVRLSLWSATLRGSVRLHAAGRAWFDAGAGARFGLAQLQGQPADATIARGGTSAGTWAGPLAHVGIGARFGHVALALDLEAGQVLRAVSGLADEGAPIAIKGRWACATVAGGWAE